MRLLFLPVAAACVASPDDPNQATSDLLADIQLAALDDTQAEIVVKLQDRLALRGELYELEIGEEVTVTIPGIVISLVSSRLDTQPVYTATIPDPPVDTTYYVAFNRVPPDQTASGSTVSLPPSLSVTAPDAASRQEAIDITWSVSGGDDPIELLVDGPCFDTYRDEIPDEGLFTLPPGSLTGSDESCPASLTLTRLRTGLVDDNFAGGDGLAYQQRTHALLLDP
jgi:hypothetical protein